MLEVLLRCWGNTSTPSNALYIGVSSDLTEVLTKIMNLYIKSFEAFKRFECRLQTGSE